MVTTLVSAIEKGGYDEASLTSLSTADYSCISPLVKSVMEKLRPEKISLGISSLRAYGLDEDLLDDIASVKATGLTFAPEAGTQRMRDVVNKNITEEDVLRSCRTAFRHGWSQVKLYFIIGLPTETDEDIVGIAELGRKVSELARREFKRSVKVTVSVSSLVPKPHTPFQWAEVVDLPEIRRRQELLGALCRRYRLSYKHHHAETSVVEAVVPIEDRPLRDRLWQTLRCMLHDQRQAWDMQPDGAYVQRSPPDADHLGTHAWLMRAAQLHWRGDVKAKLPDAPAKDPSSPTLQGPARAAE